MIPKIDQSDDEPLAERIAEEILERKRRGENPTVEEYCEKYPDEADELRAFLPAVLAVEGLKPNSQDESGTYGSGVHVDGKRREEIGDYRILRELGRGGMGVVYEAQQQSLGRRVALKVLSRQVAGNGRAVVRFQSEAKAAARLHHTNIVPVFDVGQDGDCLYYAMQLIQGQSLDAVIEDLKRLRVQSKATENGKSKLTNLEQTVERSQPNQIAESLVSGHFHQDQFLPADFSRHESKEKNGADFDPDQTETRAFQSDSASSAVLPGQSELSSAESNRKAYFLSVARIGKQTAEALAYSHERGIIHRDIKPSNLILDAAGVIWVTDFGLAKTGDQGMTHTGDILGTLRYMSPERFKGKCDVRADLYSLGLSLYELLTLEPAFSADDQLNLVDKISKSDPASPRSMDRSIPRDLETIVLKACDKDPRRRYQSADEMAEDLERFIDDEPIKARRASLVERYARWSRRNRGLASSLTALAVSVVVIIVGLVAWASYSQGLVLDRDQAIAGMNKADKAKDTALKELNDQKEEAIRQAEENRRRKYDSDMQINLLKVIDEGSTKSEIQTNLNSYNPQSLEYQASETQTSEISNSIQSDLRDHRHNYINYLLSQTSVYYKVEGSGPLSVAGGPLSTILTLRMNGLLQQWGESKKESMLRFDFGELVGHDQIRYCTLSRDGKHAALTTRNGWLYLYDLTDLSTPYLIHKERMGFVMEMKFINGDKELAIASSEIRKKVINLPKLDEAGPSPGLTEPTGILFQNHLDQEIEVWWIDVEGNKKSYGSLDPNGGYTHLYTYVGHIFELTTTDGKRIAVFKADQKHGRAVVGNRTENSGSKQNDDADASYPHFDLSFDIIDMATGEKKIYPVDPEMLRYLRNDAHKVLLQNWQMEKNSEWKRANGNKADFFSQDGKTILLPGVPLNTSLTWLGSERTESISTRTALSQSATFSNDGKTIIVSSSQGSTRILDRKGVKTSEVKYHSGFISAVEVSADDKFLATGGDEGLINVYDVSLQFKPELLFQFKAHSSPINGLFFVEGNRLISTNGGGMRVWDLTKRRRQILLNGTENAFSVDISPDDRFLAFGGFQGFELWNLNPLTRRFRQDEKCIACQFSADGKTVALGKDDKVELLNVSTGKRTELDCSFPKGIEGYGAGCVAFSPDGRFLAAGFGGHKLINIYDRTSAVLVWDLSETPKQVHSFLHREAVSSLDFSPDSKMLASIGRRKRLIVHRVDASNSKSKWTEIHKENGSYFTVRFSPNGQKLGCGMQSGHIRLLDVNEWTREGQELIGPPTQIRSLRFSQDGQYVTAGMRDNTVRTWHLASGSQVFKLQTKDQVIAIDRSANDKWLVAGTHDGIIIWPGVQTKWNTPLAAAESLEMQLSEIEDEAQREALIRSTILHPATLQELRNIRGNDLSLQIAQAELMQISGKDKEAKELIAEVENQFFDGGLENLSDGVAHRLADAIELRAIEKINWKELQLSETKSCDKSRRSNDQPGVRIGGSKQEFVFYSDCPLTRVNSLRLEFIPEIGAANQNESFILQEIEAYIDTGKDKSLQRFPLTCFQNASKAEPYDDAIDGNLTTQFNIGASDDGVQWGIFSCDDSIATENRKFVFVVRVKPNLSIRRIRVQVSDKPLNNAVVTGTMRNKFRVSRQRSGLERLAVAYCLADEFGKAEEALKATTSNASQNAKDKHRRLVLNSLIQHGLGNKEASRTSFAQVSQPIARRDLDLSLELMKLAYTRVGGMSETRAMSKAQEFWRKCMKRSLALYSESNRQDLGSLPTLKDRKSLVIRERWYDAAIIWEHTFAETDLNPTEWLTSICFFAKAVRENQCHVDEYIRLCNLFIDELESKPSLVGEFYSDITHFVFRILDPSELRESQKKIRFDNLPQLSPVDVESLNSRLAHSLFKLRNNQNVDVNAVKKRINEINEVATNDGIEKVALILLLISADEHETARNALLAVKEKLEKLNKTGHVDGRSLAEEFLSSRSSAIGNMLILNLLMQEAESKLKD